MRKIFFTLAALMMISLCQAQGFQKRELKGNKHYWKDIQLPIDDNTKKITFEGVVKAEGDQETLYKAAEKWAIQQTNSSDKEQIDFMDEINHELILTKSFPFYTGSPISGTYQQLSDISFQINLKFREGRYKFNITNFQLVYDGNSSELEVYLESLKKNIKKDHDRVCSQVAMVIEGVIVKGVTNPGIIDNIIENVKAGEDVADDNW